METIHYRTVVIPFSTSSLFCALITVLWTVHPRPILVLCVDNEDVVMIQAHFSPFPRIMRPNRELLYYFGDMKKQGEAC